MIVTEIFQKLFVIFSLQSNYGIVAINAFSNL